jgi:HK97 family phage prohead protease
MSHERRTVGLGSAAVEVREASKGPGLIVGHGAVYYDPNDPSTRYMMFDDVEERVAPGAFDRAIKDKQDVRALWNHSPDKVLGRTTAGTLRLSTDARGLKYEVDPPAHAADVVESIKRGDVTGSSFGFRVVKDAVVKETRNGQSYYIRTIEDVDLYDVSPVTFPAYVGSDAGARAAIVARAIGGDPEAEAAAIRAAAVPAIDPAETARAEARNRELRLRFGV